MLNNKNILFTGGIVLSFTLCYVFGIKRTLSVREELEYLKTASANYNSDLRTLKNLQKIESEQQSILKTSISHNISQQSLIKFFNRQSKNLEFNIAELKLPHLIRSTEKLLTVETFEISLTSPSYKTLETVLYSLEKEQVGHVSAVSIYKNKSTSKKQTLLTMQIWLQSFFISD